MLDEILEAVAVPLAVVRRGPGESFALDAANARLAALLRPAPGGEHALPLCPAAAGLPAGALAALREAAATGRDVCRAVALGPGEVPHRLLVRAAPGAGTRYVLTFVPEPAAVAEPARTALQILDLQSEMVSRWLPDGTILYCNEAFARQCGRPKDEVTGGDLWALTPPEEIGQILANIRKLSPARPTAAYDHRIPLPGGGERWQEWIDRALFDPEGRTLGYLSVGRDITLRKEAERRLAGSQRRLKLALAAGWQSVWELDLAVGKLRFEPPCLARFGWDEARCEYRLTEMLELVHPEDRPRVRRAYEECRAGRRVQAADQTRPRQAARRSDALARLGGDEFAVVAGELRSKGAVVRLAGRIRAAIRNLPATLDGAALLDVSIGVAFFPGDGGTPERLFTAADAALYAAKRERAGWRFAGSRHFPVPPVPKHPEPGSIDPPNGMAVHPS